MPNLLTYGIILMPERAYQLKTSLRCTAFLLEYVEERLVAARLCFDKQVHHIEFTQNC